MQKIYRGCRSCEDMDSVIRKQFYATFVQKGERACVKDLCTASSDYIPSLLHLFSLGSEDNLEHLCIACELRKKLLQFVTGTSRSPVGGFKHLIPVFSITKQVGDNNNCLPTASNCENMLKLPCYNSSLTLKEKLIKAISHDTGFD